MVPFVLIFVVVICCAIVALTFCMGNIADKISARAGFKTRPPVLISKEEASGTIFSSPFFDNMTPNDLSARNVRSREEYKIRYLGGIREFTPAEKTRLTSLISQANSLLSPFEHISKIPWRLVKMSRDIENGWSHTLGSIIFLNETSLEATDSNLLRTLLHEKVHLYQRKYKDETGKFVELTPYRVYSRRNSFLLLANNPDTDDFVYSFRDGPIYMGHKGNFPTENDPVLWYQEPGNITRQTDYRDLGMDPVLSQVDHPYEFMAGYIAAALVFDISSVLPDIKRWMYRYL